MHRHSGWSGGGRAAGLALLLLVGVGAAGRAQESDLVSLQADPAQWVMPNGNYAAWNYSPLDQIDLDNVGSLSVAWTLPLPVLDAHQAAPLVVGDTMYLVTPKPNRVYAIDLARDGVVRWEFRAEHEDLELVTVRACCGAKTRGLAFAEGKIFFNTLDGVAMALDAATGAVVWEDDPTDYPVSEVRTGAPLVVGRNVIFGVSGGDRGVRGHVTAHDVDTGEVRWRYYNLGPNDDVGIGPRFQPFYADDRIPNPALDFQSSAISYLGPDGRQYVAILASSPASDPRVSFDARPDAGFRYRRGGTALYVFALPAGAVQPENR